jgi:NAD(P)H-nitrite reductase large subunit
MKVCIVGAGDSGAIEKWEELYRGLRRQSFYEKRDINLHLNTEVTDILRQEKCIIADEERYSYDKLVLALGSTLMLPHFPGLDGKNEFTLSTDIADGKTLANIVRYTLYKKEEK